MIGTLAVSETFAAKSRPLRHALGDDTAGAEEGAVLDDHRRRVQRLEHAADPDPAREVDVGADLGYEPTVAQVSTIVRGLTEAPMLT